MSSDRREGDAEAEPRWLDETEIAAWIPFGIVLMRLPIELDRQLQRDSDLHLIEYLVLSGLSEAPDRTMRMSVLATWSGSQLPRLSQVASRMEARGWVTRRQDPTDGRSTLVTLTDSGFEVLAAAAPGHVDNVRRLVIDRLTRAQVSQLATIMQRLLVGISHGERPPNQPG